MSLLIRSQVATALALASSLVACSPQDSSPQELAGRALTLGSFDCPSGMRVLVGTDGPDILTGTASADCIVGLAGDDTIRGRGGNDVIYAGEGDDQVHGGAGNDRIWGGLGNDILLGEGGADTLDGEAGDDHLKGGGANDTLLGSCGSDRLEGNAGDDVLTGGPGTDTLLGGVGNNSLEQEGDTQLVCAESSCSGGTSFSAEYSACKPCPAGTYAGPAALTCTTCTAGSYCVAQSTIPSPCPGGSYCPAASVDPILCPQGSYCPSESAMPLPCPVGSTCPAGSSTPETEGLAFVDDGSVLADLTPSRLSGIAPLLVAFDATASTAVGADRPFHDLHYQWDFGDENAGSWALSGKSKNRALGAVAGHVFDHPGLYTVSLTVRDGHGKGQRKQVTIDVQDADVAFAESTYCFSTGTDFSGCPAGGQQITTDSLATIRSFSAENRRLLLRRGDSWEATENIGVGARFGQGTSILGAFGVCEAPDARGICANAPLLYSTVPDIFLLTVEGDVRVMDIALSGLTTESRQVGIDLWSGRGTLLYRLRMVGFSVAIVTSFTQEQPALIDSDIGQAYTNQVFLCGEQLMIMGNHLHDSALSHVLRVWQSYRGVIAENLIAHSSIASDLGRQALKLHGPTEDQLSQLVLPSGGTIHRTSLTIVSDNTFVASPPWPVTIGPQNVISDERIGDVIVERNLWRAAGTRDASAPPPFMGLRSSALNDLTVRNNIFDATGATDGYAAIEVAAPTLPALPVTNVEFANNLIYRSDRVGNEIWMVTVGERVQNLVVRNNLGVALSYPLKRFAFGDLSQTIEDHNLWSESADFVSSAPSQPSDFAPTAASQSIDMGARTSALDDYTGTLRQDLGNPDLGPFEYAP